MTTPTDEPDQPVWRATPAEEAAVRRLLAGARETGPVPDDVATRLDATLAGLVEERAGAVPSPEPEALPDGVVPLTPRRRLRAGLLLGAAAAVITGGLVLGQVTADQDARPAADSGAEADRPSVARSGDDQLSTGADKAEAEDQEPGDGGVVDGGGAVPGTPVDETVAVIRPDRLLADVRRVRRAELPDPESGSYAALTVRLPSDFRCKPVARGRGLLVGVEYDGRNALLVFRPPMGDSQVAEILQCGTGEVLRSTTLPIGE